MAVSGYDLVAFAKQYIGTPYAWGGNSLTNGVDCSGLVQQVYKNFGIQVSRTTYTQIGEGKAIKMNELKAGDMVFFDTDPGTGGPDHVGIYMGDGKMIHAPRPGKSVEISDLTTGYWQGIFMGGRRVSGLQGGGPASESEPAAAARLSPEEMAAEYGWAYSFLNSIPEIKGLFKSYVAEDWSKDKFQAKLRDTKWWKTNSDSMRKTAQEKKTDPATFSAKLNAMRIQIMQLAGEMGASIPPSKLGKLAEQAISTNMDEALLRNVLGGYVTWTDANNLRGQAGMFEHNMKQFAAEQGVTLDKQTMLNQAQLIAKGLATEQDFRSQVVNQAASLYPAYTEQLLAGQTMKEIASPYMEVMAQDLEINPAAVTLADPLLRSALNGVNKQGKPVGMDLTTFQNVVRNDPRWARSQSAQSKTMETGLKVLKDMGFAGGK
jgi:hypothetical protein